GAVARVWVAGPLPLAAAGDEAGVGKQQARRLVGLPGGEQAAGMVEMQVGQQHDVDVAVLEAGSGQAVEQHMVAFLDAETFLYLRREERTDAGFDEDVA